MASNSGFSGSLTLFLTVTDFCCFCAKYRYVLFFYKRCRLSPYYCGPCSHLCVFADLFASMFVNTTTLKPFPTSSWYCHGITQLSNARKCLTMRSHARRTRSLGTNLKGVGGRLSVGKQLWLSLLWLLEFLPSPDVCEVCNVFCDSWYTTRSWCVAPRCRPSHEHY